MSPLLLLLVPSLAFAGGEASLFPHRAPIEVDAGGVQRLDLDPEILAAARPDLSDLRIHSAEGVEVAWMVDGGGWRVDRRVVPDVIDRQRSERWRDGDWRWRETLLLAAPDRGGDGPWRMHLQPSHREFVRRVIVRQNGRVVAGPETVWRLDGGREKLHIDLPPLGSGPIEIELAGDGFGWLDAGVVLEAAREGTARRLDLPLALLRRSEGDGQTDLVLSRPRGQVPDTLKLRTGSLVFDRDVIVWDEGPGRRLEPLGRGRVHRLPGDPPVEQLRVPLTRTPRGTELRVTIVDGDSPPLADLGVVAQLDGPSLVFELGAGDGVDGWLYVGGGRARAPSYDLQRLLGDAGADAIQRRLREPGAVGEARRGDLVTNPLYEAGPRLAFAARAGAVVDSRAWSHERGLEVGAADEGVHRVVLTASDLGRLRPDRGDLRVIDEADRQYPYLSRARVEPVPTDLELSDRSSSDGSSAWIVRLPGGEAPVETLALTLEEPFFDRAWRVETTDEAPRTIASGRLVRREDPRPVQLELGGTRAEELRLVVEDGDDAPLTLLGARAWLPGWELWLAAPAGRYRLLLGNPSAEPPSYELESVRGVVLTTAAPSVEPGPLGTNEGHVSRLHRPDEGHEQWLVWGVLGLAIVVLGGLTLANARGEEPAEED